MNFKQWAASAQLKPHKTSSKEIERLFAIVERDLYDARISATSLDGRYVSAYNAALKLCTVLLYVSGYRTSGAGAHHRTIEALPLILGDSFQSDADYLDDCREKRNHAEYDYVDVVEEIEVEELIRFVDEFRESVQKWLKDQFSEMAE